MELGNIETSFFKAPTSFPSESTPSQPEATIQPSAVDVAPAPAPAPEISPVTSEVPATPPTSATMEPKDIGVPDLTYTGKTEAYVPPAAPTFSGRDIKEEDTVAGRIKTLLDDKNPYSLAAMGKQKGMEYAQSRGLVNTSIAGEAGVRGAMDAVLPAATTDVNIRAQAGQSAQEAGQTTGLEGYRGEISSGLSKQEHEQKIDWERVAQELTGTREDQKIFAELSTGIQQKYQDDYVKIQTTPDSVMSPAAKAEAIAQLNMTTQSQVEGLSAIYNVEMSWSDGIVAITPDEIEAIKVADAEKKAAAVEAEATAAATKDAEDLAETAGYIDPGSYLVQQGLEEIGVDTMYEDLGIPDPAKVIASWF